MLILMTGADAPLVTTADAVITKPFTKLALLTLLEVLRKKKAARSLASTSRMP